MGCDIHAYVEQRNDGGQWAKVPDVWPFDGRSYSTFGFLADVRNYSLVPPIAEPRGLPDDVSQEVADDHAEWDTDAHTESWLSVRELVDFDYDQVMNDRRVKRQIGLNSWDHGATGAPEEGTPKTYREFLGEHFMHEVENLQKLGDPDQFRVTFWFDN